MNKILLFDFDGTIADSFENFLEIIAILSPKYHLPTISRQELEELRKEGASSVIKKLKIPFYKIPFMARDMKKLQQMKIKEIKPYKGLSEVLHILKKKGYTLGIMTSNGKENVKIFLKENNIDIFDYVYTDTNLFGKDKALRRFLKQHTLTKDKVLYIGDEIRDIEACHKAGLQILAVTWGFNTKEGLVKHNPDFLVDTPQALKQLLI